MPDPSVIIIGAGIAGLSAGCYARMNGYHTRIFEMHHSLPGGLCTAWTRQGYTIDGCIHWLVGSQPGNPFYRLWEEVGLVQSREFIYLDEMVRIVGRDGRTFTFFTDLDRLERHMLEVAPEDRPLIEEFMAGVRGFRGFNPPASDPPPVVMNPLQKARLIAAILPHLPRLRKWAGISVGEFSARFRNPLLREAFEVIWHPEFGLFFIMMTLAWMHDRVAGYPIGGSLPLAKAVERRFLDLGGLVTYKARVTKILVQDNRAIGVRLEDGREERADAVISAADGHATIFDLLEGRYVDDAIRRTYAELVPFPSLVYVGLGVNRSFVDEPRIISGYSLPLDPPLELGKSVDRIGVHIANFDPTLAPEGKTTIVAMLHGNYAYWKALRADPARYAARKRDVSDAVIRLLDGRYPGLAGQVEMTNVATPLTWERYTGNWLGSYEGWMPTPAVGLNEMSKTLPGLDRFYMAGQWVSPGGGLPGGVKTGRDVVQMLCRRDKVKFTTEVA
jgi:phytoene dehydrogenase-like protein